MTVTVGILIQKPTASGRRQTVDGQTLNEHILLESLNNYSGTQQSTLTLTGVGTPCMGRQNDLLKPSQTHVPILQGTWRQSGRFLTCFNRLLVHCA